MKIRLLLARFFFDFPPKFVPLTKIETKKKTSDRYEREVEDQEGFGLHTSSRYSIAPNQTNISIKRPSQLTRLLVILTFKLTKGEVANYEAELLQVLCLEPIKDFFPSPIDVNL